MTHRGPFPQPGGAGGRAAAQRRGAGPRRWERWSKALRGSLQATSTRAAVSFMRPPPPPPMPPTAWSVFWPRHPACPGEAAKGRVWEVVRGHGDGGDAERSLQPRPRLQGKVDPLGAGSLAAGPTAPSCGHLCRLHRAPRGLGCRRHAAQSLSHGLFPVFLTFPFVATWLVITLSTLGLCCVWHIAPQVLAIS